MKKVYIVTAGSYDDYHIDSVFGDEASAQAYAASPEFGEYDHPTVEVFEVRPKLGPHRIIYEAGIVLNLAGPQPQGDYDKVLDRFPMSWGRPMRSWSKTIVEWDETDELRPRRRKIVDGAGQTEEYSWRGTDEDQVLRLRLDWATKLRARPDVADLLERWRAWDRERQQFNLAQGWSENGPMSTGCGMVINGSPVDFELLS